MATTTKPWRRSVDLDGAVHKAPIPMGSVVGNMLFTSGVMGTDAATGKLADGLEAQTQHAFRNLDALLDKAGGTLGDIGRLTVYLATEAGRLPVNTEWLARFPDPLDRPARHVIVKELPGGMLVQLEAIAVLKERNK